MRTHRYALLTALSLVLCTGCATLHPAQVGHLVGTIAGAALAPGIGAPLGGLVGILTGSALQRGFNKANEGRERAELRQQLKRPTTSSAPQRAGTSVLQTIPTRVWVDERVEEGRLVAGHFDVRQLQ